MSDTKIDAFINTVNPAEAAREAAALDAMGCDGIASFEGPHEPFLPLAVAAQHTESALLYPAVAIAFARNPMMLAYLANDLQMLARGRFALGLGTQIRAHIEKRFSMPWSHPVERMQEFVSAVRAIWASWEKAEVLNFRGQFYNHYLMPPLLNPGPNEYGTPPIWLAGVGARMTRMAASTADGFIVHPFHTLVSLDQLTLPSLRAGSGARSRELGSLEVCCQVIVAVGRDEEELKASTEAARLQVAFYGSTPAYKPVLDCVGLGELQLELNALSKQGEWQKMGDLIGDDLLKQIIVAGTPEEVAEQLVCERGKLVDRIAPSMQVTNRDAQHALLKALIRERDRA